MTWVRWVLIAYGVFNIVLGVIGFVNSNSLVSLIAGGVAGLLILGCAALGMKGKPRVGNIAALVITLLLLGRFAPTFFETGDWMPAGISMVAGVIVVLCLVAGHFMAMSARKKEAGEA